MEAFSLLKYWRSGSAAAAGNNTLLAGAAAVSPCSSDGEEGPYIDLEFSLYDAGEDKIEKNEESCDQKEESDEEIETGSESSADETEYEEEEEEGEVKLGCTDDSVSGEIFLNANLVPVSINGCEENSKFPVFLAKSATKFRVLLLKLKKSKSSNGVTEKNENYVLGQKQSTGKLLAVKLNVDDCSSETNSASSDERKLSKEVMQKYLKMVKPFYVRVSKRYAGKLKFSGRGRAETAAQTHSNGKTQLNLKQMGNGKLQAGLKVVRKHLGKSRSTSATITAVTTSQQPPRRFSSSITRWNSKRHSPLQEVLQRLQRWRIFNNPKQVVE